MTCLETHLTGTETACPEGYTSANGFTPNCELAGQGEITVYTVLICRGYYRY